MPNAGLEGFLIVKKVKIFLPAIVLSLFSASCVLLSVAPRAYETLPENIQIGSLKTEGIFVYTEKDYAKNADKNPIFIQGKIKNPAFNIKDFLSVSEAKKKIWDYTIVSSGGTVGIQCGFAVYTNKEGENIQFDISPISFNKNYLEFPDAVSKQDVPIPYMIAKFHDEKGRCYKVFAAAIGKYTHNSPKYLVMDTKQEFSVFFENNLAARFSGRAYKIYSETDPELLKEYVGVLNGVFRGIRKYEKGILLF